MNCPLSIITPSLLSGRERKELWCSWGENLRSECARQFGFLIHKIILIWVLLLQGPVCLFCWWSIFMIRCRENANFGSSILHWLSSPPKQFFFPGDWVSNAVCWKNVDVFRILMRPFPITPSVWLWFLEMPKVLNFYGILIACVWNAEVIGKNKLNFLNSQHWSALTGGGLWGSRWRIVIYSFPPFCPLL